MQRNLSFSAWDRILPLVLMVAGIGIAAIALGADLLYSGGPQGIGLTQVSLALSGLPFGWLASFVWMPPSAYGPQLAADELEAVMAG